MTGHRIRAASAVLAGLLLATALAACSAPDSTTPAAATPAASSTATPANGTATVPASATPTPSPTVMTVPVARAAYLAAVCPANVAAGKLNAALRSAQPLYVKIVAAARKEASASQAAYRGLAQPALPWPRAVRADISTIATGFLDEAAWAGRIADTENVDTQIAIAVDVPASLTSKKMTRAIQSVRALLGLPVAGDGKGGCRGVTASNATPAPASTPSPTKTPRSQSPACATARDSEAFAKSTYEATRDSNNASIRGLQVVYNEQIASGDFGGAALTKGKILDLQDETARALSTLRKATVARVRACSG